MTVKIYRPEEIKDANLVSSTLPEPDASRGEVEWQGYADKIFRWTKSPKPSGSIIDCTYAEGYGVYVLHGFENDIRLSRYNLSGGLEHEFQVPNLAGNDRNAGGLSITRLTDSTARLHIGIYDFKTSEPNAETYYVSIMRYNVSKSNPSSLSPAGVRSIPHAEYTGSTYGTQFKIKTDGLEGETVIVKKDFFLAGDREIKIFDTQDEVTATIESNAYLSVLPSEDGKIYALGSSPIGFGSDRRFQLFELNRNLGVVRSFTGLALDGQWSNPTLSAFGVSLSHSTSPSFGAIEMQAFDNNGINIGSYKSGDNVIVKDTHKRYQAIKNAIFSYPPDNSQDGGDWIELGPTNRWGMLDGEINTKSRSANGHTINLTPNYLFDSISIFGCKNVTEIKVTVRNSANAVIFQKDEDMTDLIAALEWQQDPLNPDLFSEVTIDGIPTAAGAKIELQFIGSNIEVGLVRYGLSREVGESVTGLSQNYFDYSKVEYNDFGRLIYQERPIVKLNTYKILVQREKTRSVDRLINSYRGQNVVWSGSSGNGEKLVTYGRAQRSPLTYDYPTINQLEITVRGSI